MRKSHHLLQVQNAYAFVTIHVLINVCVRQLTYAILIICMLHYINYSNEELEVTVL